MLSYHHFMLMYVPVGFITCNTVPSCDSLVTGTEGCPLKADNSFRTVRGSTVIGVHWFLNLTSLKPGQGVFMCSILSQTCETGTEIVGKEAIVLGRSKIVVSPHD